jgi:hypothetical protein
MAVALYDFCCKAHSGASLDITRAAIAVGGDLNIFLTASRNGCEAAGLAWMDAGTIMRDMKLFPYFVNYRFRTLRIILK